MTDLDAAIGEFAGDAQDRPATAPPRKCRRHVWVPSAVPGDHDYGIGPIASYCARCHIVRDEQRVRRARNNRSRGLALQRKVLAAMDLEHIPGNKPNHDGRSRGENGLHVAEVKSGARFRGEDYVTVTGIPAKAGQARWLVLVETPGRGRKARVLVATTLEDWQSLFVGTVTGVEDDAA